MIQRAKNCAENVMHNLYNLVFIVLFILLRLLDIVFKMWYVCVDKLLFTKLFIIIF